MKTRDEVAVRILYITQTFPPEPGPTIRPLRQAVHLQKLGHVVTILTTMPNAPLGRVFKRYRGKLWMFEVLEGVEVLRVWSLPVANHGFFLRTLSCISFSLVALICGFFLKRRDLVIASVPNIATEMAAFLIARRKRSCWLLEMRDLIPENLALAGISSKSPFWRLLKRYYAWMFKRADLIAVAGAGMKHCLEAQGLPSRKLLLLPHAADDGEQPEEGARASPPVALRGDFIAMFCGSFSAYYDLETILAAARLLEGTEPAVRVCLLGTGRERPRIERQLRDRPCRTITLLNAVPPNQVSRYLRHANVALSPIVVDEKCPYLDGYLTTKAVEYLHAGKPIIAIESQRVLSGLLSEIGAGLAVPARNAERLAQAIRHFALHPKQAARCGAYAKRYAEQYLMRDRIIADFESRLMERLNEIVLVRGAAEHES